MKVQDVRAVLAKRLREFRVSAGLTTVDVGSAIGKSDKTISGWEHGRGQPDADMLFVLCDLYKVKNVSAFFPTSRDMEDEYSADEEELICSYRSLNDEGKGTILSTIRVFASSPAMQRSQTHKINRLAAHNEGGDVSELPDDGEEIALQYLKERKKRKEGF